MTEEAYMTYALWGAGYLDAKNAKALLEEYIPDNVGTVYRPERITRDQAGLRTALAWFESPEFLGEGGAVPTTDPIQSLLDDRDYNGDEVYLLALCPANPTHEDVNFLERAQNEGITVFDLSRALDEVDLSLPAYQRPEPTKEEKAEAKAEAKAEVKKPTRRRTREPVAEAEGAGVLDGLKEDLIADVPANVLVPEISNEHVAYALASMNLMDAIDKYVEAKMVHVLSRYGITINLEAPPAPTAETAERPPFDGPYVDVDTESYYRSKTGYYRLATGSKPRAGEILENLTAEQVADFKISGLIK
jgi:hypothetical protein